MVGIPLFHAPKVGIPLFHAPKVDYTQGSPMVGYT